MRRLLTLALAVALSVTTLTGPAWAWQIKSGTANCGQVIAYTQARFYTNGEIRPPGSYYVYYYYLSSAWHTRQRDGNYSGSWYAVGDPSLNMSSTFAGCRNYG